MSKTAFGDSLANQSITTIFFGKSWVGKQFMPTVINNPGSENGSGTNLVVGFILVIIVLAAVVLFFMYGLPMIKSNSTPSSTPNSNGINVNVKLPIPGAPTTDNTTAK